MLHNLLFIILILFGTSCIAGEVAFTIDDLPYVGKARKDPGKLRRERNRFLKILDTLQKEQVTAAGFVVPGFIETDQQLLIDRFHKAGHLIGNHTYSHMNLNTHTPEAFQQDVLRADTALTPYLSQPKYFRFPFLATGRTCKTFLTVKQFLSQHGYVIAPVTIDSKDFRFNQAFHNVPWRQRKKAINHFRQKYIGFIRAQIIKAEKKAQERVQRPIKHIFLIHMNTINAHFLSDIIHLFRQRDYRFITLPEALRDPYYQSDMTELSLNHRRCQLKKGS